MDIYWIRVKYTKANGEIVVDYTRAMVDDNMPLSKAVNNFKEAHKHNSVTPIEVNVRLDQEKNFYYH